MIVGLLHYLTTTDWYAWSQQEWETFNILHPVLLQRKNIRFKFLVLHSRKHSVTATSESGRWHTYASWMLSNNCKPQTHLKKTADINSIHFWSNRALEFQNDQHSKLTNTPTDWGADLLLYATNQNRWTGTVSAWTLVFSAPTFLLRITMFQVPWGKETCKPTFCNSRVIQCSYSSYQRGAGFSLLVMFKETKIKPKQKTHLTKLLERTKALIRDSSIKYWPGVTLDQDSIVPSRREQQAWSSVPGLGCSTWSKITVKRYSIRCFNLYTYF